MKNKIMCLAVFMLLVAGSALPAVSQVRWMIGGRVGMSMVSAGGETSAGLQIGPTLELIFHRNMAIVEGFNINTQNGTPIEWSNYFKYYITRTRVEPYLDAGFSFWFVGAGPYLGIPFGGGVLFEISRNLYIPMDFQFGPIFFPGNNVFGVEVTSGIRYEF